MSASRFYIPAGFLTSSKIVEYNKLLSLFKEKKEAEGIKEFNKQITDFIYYLYNGNSPNKLLKLSVPDPGSPKSHTTESTFRDDVLTKSIVGVSIDVSGGSNSPPFWVMIKSAVGMAKISTAPSEVVSNGQFLFEITVRVIL